MFQISQILPELQTIKIVDVGAMSTGENAYDRVAEAFACEVVGFEPEEEACRKLNAEGLPGRTYLPYFVGDGSTQTFHQCADPYNSSLLEPNLALIEQFTEFAPFMQVVARHQVATRRLDDIAEAAGADYLKLDVQGAELMVLEGAARTLQSVLVAHIEVEFVPLYKDQPHFGDIDTRMRQAGFLLHRMPFTGLRSFTPFPLTMYSQHIWCDFLYVRDFMNLNRLRPEQLLKLAAILHEDYKSCDFAGFVLGAYDRQTGTDLAAQYLGYALAN